MSAKSIIDEMTPNQWLDWVCASKTYAELQEKYDQWAAVYDAHIAHVWEPVPLAAATLLVAHIGDKARPILDVGAGTGLAGAALATLGCTHIQGMDLSSAMLTKASERGIYQSLVCCVIGDETFMSLPPASGMIATGVFAESHAGASELEILQTTIEPGGVLVFTVRESFLPEIENILRRPTWRQLDVKILPIYEDPMHLLAYKIDSNR